ncbi:MAG: hypothetical protein IT450_13010 [Phycisphaerales bacterium]|nr:hypothetical protein [Phycisphaerales bacterium]
MFKSQFIVVGLCAAAAIGPAQAQDCTPVWSMTPYRATNNVGALLVHDDGNGPGLLIGSDRGITFLRDNIVTMQRQTPSMVYRFRQVTVDSGIETYAFGLSGVFRLNGGGWDTVSLGSAGGGDVAVFDDGRATAFSAGE